MRKLTTCIGKNEDQLRGNRKADQCPCFPYTDSTLPLLLKSKISSFKPASVTVQYSLICVGPVLKPHCLFSHETTHIYRLCYGSVNKPP